MIKRRLMSVGIHGKATLLASMCCYERKTGMWYGLYIMVSYTNETGDMYQREVESARFVTKQFHVLTIV